MNLDLNTASPLYKFQLNKLNELRRDTYDDAHSIKEKIKAVHDQHILYRMFNSSKKVLLYNS